MELKHAPHNATGQQAHWSNLQESGTIRGILFMLWLQRVFGRRFFNALLYPVMIYFFMFNRRARQASLEFLQTHAAKYPDYWQGKLPGYRDVFRHMYSFGQCILDKLLAWSTPIREQDFEIAQEPLLAEFMAKTTGQLIIGSHLGNLEYCRGFVQRYKARRINALVYDQHSANFVAAMQKINPESRIHIYQVNELDIPLILQLKAKIEQGEWLFIAGDRIPLSGEARTVTVDFLGRPAQFPIGPYMLAKVLQCEVQLMFSYRKAQKIYFELVPFAQQVTLPRKDGGAQLQAYAQQYASALEQQAARAPLQWFNFYPYWSSSRAANESAHKLTAQD
ncbi:LpxL/LpxP family acyltransferase [Cellvibrio fontiphilus]|uniref:Lipid A biosynthesis acyltransferase n=1 Tax=Cellvibrio fontiphilus TaxID=1815559 RepID=A0ABV7FDT8_9GAMM